MSALPDEVPSLMIPMHGRPWLVPNIIVAEIIPLRQPDRPASGADWLLGILNWRDEDVPLISFERLNDSGNVSIGPDARIAVVNNVSGKVKFYAVIIQGIPRLAKVTAAEVIEEPVDSGPAESMYVQLGGELAVIPDLDAIERAIEGISLA